MNPVRVSFVIDRLSRAGTESQLLALIRHVDRSRVEPTLVLLDGSDELSRSLEPAGCRVLRLGTKKLLSRGGLTALHALRKFWQQTRPDVVQAYFLDSSYLALPLARFMGISATVRVQNNLGYWLTPKHRVLNCLLRWVTTRKLTNSQLGRDAIRRAERLPPSRVAVIENGVDLDRFTEVRPPFHNPSAVRVGCVANLRPVKNVDGLIRAAREVCDRFPHVTFAIAGDGEQRPELETLRSTLGLENRVELLGSVTDVPGFLRTLDVAVLPSHSEGMSNALLEYMAAGRAVVATDVGANAQLLARGECGLLASPNSHSSIAETICRVVGDAEFAQRLGVRARARVEASYSRTAMCRRFEDFYRSIVTNDLPQNPVRYSRR